MEKIKLIHIAPTNLIPHADKHFNKGLNMVLAHLVLINPTYRDACKALQGEKYLDNSFYELGYCLSTEEMARAAGLVSATMLICPDGTKDGIDAFKAAGYKVMCIPKSPEQFVEFMLDARIDMVGISATHIDYKHSPGARYELFRDYITDAMPKKKIHLLGATDSVRELSLIQPFTEYIRSWDSSAAVWQGHLGNLLKEQKRKCCESVDFSNNITWNLFMESNIQFLEEQIK